MSLLGPYALSFLVAQLSPKCSKLTLDDSEQLLPALGLSQKAF